MLCELRCPHQPPHPGEHPHVMECTACLLQPHCSLQPHRRYKDPSAYRAQQASLLLLLPTIHSRAPGSLATSCHAQIGISHCGWLPDPSPTPWGTYTALLPRSRCCREGEMMRKRAAQSLASPHFPQTHNTAVPLPWCPPIPPRPIPGQVAVLLQVRVSRSNPLHSVPYGEETQERVRGLWLGGRQHQVLSRRRAAPRFSVTPRKRLGGRLRPRRGFVPSGPAEAGRWWRGPEHRAQGLAVLYFYTFTEHWHVFIS